MDGSVPLCVSMTDVLLMWLSPSEYCVTDPYRLYDSQMHTSGSTPPDSPPTGSSRSSVQSASGTDRASRPRPGAIGGTVTVATVHGARWAGLCTRARGGW